MIRFTRITMIRFSRFLGTLLLILVLTSCAGKASPQAQRSPATAVAPIYTDCNHAELVSETIPVGSHFKAGETFEKNWIIRNISPCTWPNSYSLVYYAGTGMGESTHRKLTEFSSQGNPIKPGETVTLSLSQRAPFAPGRQVGYWKLRNPAGILFVPDNISQDYLGVDIEVVGTVYSFADNYCQASWSLDGEPIACPMNDASGSYDVTIDHFPTLENGSIENESTISIRLPADEDNIMAATFPSMVIQKGDHLHLATSCAYQNPQCDLTFTITALTETGSIVIGEWHEVTDNSINEVNLDLSYLADQSIEFIFSLRSNDLIENNRGLWFFPVLLPY